MMLEDAETARPSRRVGALMIRKARPESIDVLRRLLRFAFKIFVMIHC